MKIQGRVIDGEFVPDSKAEYSIILQRFEGENVELSLNTSTKRSTAQNRFYWGVIIPSVLEGLKEAGWNSELLKDTDINPEDVNLIGYGDPLNKEAVHKYLLSKFFPYKECNSIKSLNPIHFGMYMAEVRRWAETYLNVKIPDEQESSFEFEITINDET